MDEAFNDLMFVATQINQNRKINIGLRNESQLKLAADHLLTDHLLTNKTPCKVMADLTKSALRCIMNRCCVTESCSCSRA